MTAATLKTYLALHGGEAGSSTTDRDLHYGVVLNTGFHIAWRRAKDRQNWREQVEMAMLLHGPSTYTMMMTDAEKGKETKAEGSEEGKGNGKDGEGPSTHFFFYNLTTDDDDD